MKIYELEAAIMECWNVVNDIETILECATLENVPSAMNAVRELYDLKFTKLFETYESVIRENHKGT